MSVIDDSKPAETQNGEQFNLASYYYRYPACSDLIDWRDLDALVLHVGPLPHPAED